VGAISPPMLCHPSLFSFASPMAKPAPLTTLSGLLLTGGLAVPLFSVLPASAVTVTIGSADYDVIVFEGTYASNESLFQLPPAGQVPWWDGTGDLAVEFAQGIFDQLGQGSDPGYGPVFAYASSRSDVQGIIQSLTDPSSQLDQPFSVNSVIRYAILAPSQVPVSGTPGPLPVFGALGAFSFSRRLRRLVRNRV